MSPVLMLVKCVLLPAVVAAFATFLTRRLQRRDRPALAGWLASLPLALGYAAGHAAVAWPAFPPVEVTDRVIWLALASLMASAVASAAGPASWWRSVNRLGFTALVVATMLGPVFPEARQSWAGWGWMLGSGVVLAASWSNLDALAARLSPVALGIPLAITAFGAAAALTASGSVVLGQLCAALAASVAAAVAVAAGGPALAGCGPVCGMVAGALLIAGFVYSELAASTGLLLAAAPLTAWVPLVPGLRRRPAWVRLTVAAVAAAVPVGLAIALAASGAPAYAE